MTNIGNSFILEGIPFPTPPHKAPARHRDVVGYLFEPVDHWQAYLNREGPSAQPSGANGPRRSYLADPIRLRRLLNERDQQLGHWETWEGFAATPDLLAKRLDTRAAHLKILCAAVDAAVLLVVGKPDVAGVAKLWGVSAKRLIAALQQFFPRG